MAETNVIQVRYWAAAKAAAGVEADLLPADAPMSLAAIRSAAVARHPGTRLADVLGVCSVLVGDRPVGRADPADVLVEPGSSVEFLPPFAGGC